MAQKHKVLKNTAAIAIVTGSMAIGALRGWDIAVSPAEKPVIVTGPKGDKTAFVVQTINSGGATASAMAGGAAGGVIGAGAWIGVDMLFLSKLRRKENEEQKAPT
ncbi:MAG: hypothetical protein KGH94_04760 [Candidatus Micrarchaeota archaeon]|nr:hypothetical protein [Candidatus Micrarchaeota archaeon]